MEVRYFCNPRISKYLLIKMQIFLFRWVTTCWKRLKNRWISLIPLLVWFPQPSGPQRIMRMVNQPWLNYNKLPLNYNLLLDVPKELQHTRVSGHLLDLLGDIPTRGNKLDDKFSAGDVEIINLMGDDMSAVDPAEITLCATRLWLHRLSFILIVMGSISLLFISIFYLLAFMKHKKVCSSLILKHFENVFWFIS